MWLVYEAVARLSLFFHQPPNRFLGCAAEKSLRNSLNVIAIGWDGKLSFERSRMEIIDY